MKQTKSMPKRAQSPQDTPCLYCGKKFTSKGVYEHERNHCPKNPNRKKRIFGKLQCRVCKQFYHAAGLRTHMAIQHPLEYANDKARKRPSSKAAMRRRVARAESEKRQRHVPRSPSPRRSSSHAAASSPKDEKDRHNTESRAMAKIQREMQRVATAT